MLDANSYIVVMIVLAVLSVIFYIAIIAFGVSHGLSMYDRRKRRERKLNQRHREQRKRQEKYATATPSRGRFYDGGVKYTD